MGVAPSASGKGSRVAIFLDSVEDLTGWLPDRCLRGKRVVYRPLSGDPVRSRPETNSTRLSSSLGGEGGRDRNWFQPAGTTTSSDRINGEIDGSEVGV